ncbi:hypothetical protein [Pyrodictium abyssi]|uniref:Uncharacterized protein n=1 Tax=Pyrodictium abyssi TaxID=54256 RepID=A0ABN6ZNQ4_9CREN|nr:hypothetical protein PABY_14680 [Pyrodictium abyssi]
MVDAVGDPVHVALAGLAGGTQMAAVLAILGAVEPRGARKGGRGDYALGGPRRVLRPPRPGPRHSPRRDGARREVLHGGVHEAKGEQPPG